MRRDLRLYSLVDPLKQTAISWLDHEGPRLAASLSFYSLLSLAPLVILMIAIASLAFGRSGAEQILIDEVRDSSAGPARVRSRRLSSTVKSHTPVG